MKRKRRNKRSALKGQLKRNHLVRVIREHGLFRPKVIPAKHKQKNKINIRNFNSEDYNDE